MANKLLNLFNKIVKNEIATSNYFNSKRTSSLQNSVINSPSLNVTIGSGTGGIAGGITGGYLGSYEVEDRGTEYLVSIEAGSMNGIAWNATDIVIPKSSVEGDTFSGIYYIYVDSLTKTLVLSQITETTSPETINFVLMVVLVPDNPEGFIKGYTTEENITSFIYGYQANFYYYLFLMSNVVVGNTFAIDAGKITGNLIIDGNLTVTSASDSVLITSDGMYIYDVENVTSLGLDGNYTQSLLATFNKNGLFFYDGEGTVLSKFTKDEATIAGWTINADSLSGPNIILYADGGMQTVDFAEGIVGEIGNEEGWSKGIGWKIGSDGSAYFNDVTVFGTLYSSMGNIAGWEITGEYIANGNIVLASKGEIYTASYIPEISGWKIRWDGLAEFNNAIIRGTLFSDVGYIGNWNINSGIISSHSATYETATSNSVGTLTLTADAVAIIYIRDLNTGQLYQQDQVTFTAPRTVEGLQADTEHVIHYITAYDGIKLDSGGSISANYVANTSGWSINATGDAEFNTILIRDGDFQNGELGGNWVVTEDGKLQNGTDIVLDGANKIIYFNNKSTYSADTTAGIFIGYDSGIPKVNIGSDSAFLKWTGTELLISGTISADNGDIGGWNIGPTTLSATNIILDSTGTIKTSDYSAGVFGTTTEIETKTSSGSGTITLNYPALSIVSVKVSGSDVTYTYVPQTKTLTNLVDLSTVHVITYIRENTTAGSGWKIDSTGNAVFNDVTVFGTLYSSGGNIAGWDINEGYLANGNIVLNTSGEIYTANYNHGISGWKIRYDGFAEFNEILVRGEIESGSGNIGGWLITGTTIESEGTTGIIMDSTGSIGSKNFVIGSAGWKIFDDGTAEFNDIIIRNGDFKTGNVGGDTGLEVSEGILQDPSGTLVIDSVNKKIKVGNYVELGSDVKTDNYLGLKITSNNYWETNGTYTKLSLGGGKLSYDDTSGSGVLSVEGEVKATSGYIGGSSSGWHIATDMLYAGISDTVYSIMLNSNTTKIGIHRPTGVSYPAVSLGMSVLSGKHGLAFYDNTNGTSNNYWVWDTNEVKFRVGDNTNYLDFNVGTANKLTVVTDTFSLTTTNLTIDSATEKIAMGGIVLQGATYPYIGVGVTTYGANSGIWMGNSSGTYKLSIKNAAGSKYLLWDGTNLSIAAGNFTLDTSGNLTATNVNLTGSINATGGYIGGSSSGWEIGSGLIKNGTDIVLNATAKQITISNGAIKLGIDVESTNDGLYINPTNYWYSTGSFKIGSSASYITGSSSGIAINSTNFTVDNAGTIMAKLGTIGSWKLGTSQLYAGDSTNVYSIMLDAGNTSISLYKSSTSTYPAISLGMSVLTGKHGLAFYNNTNGTSNNYWVWDTNEVKFRIGDITNYLSFNVDVASKLSIVTDTFDLASTNFKITSGTYPYLGVYAQKFMGTGVFIGKGAMEVIIPNMTANNVSVIGDGTYVASDSSSSSVAFYAFKDEAATYKSLEVGAWVKIQLPVRKIVYSYNLYAPSSLYYIKGWELQGSNDNTTWVTLDSQSGHASWTGTLASDIEITDPAPYLYYRLLITEVNSPTYPYARVAMIYLYDKEGYKLSVVGSGSDPNYISFNSASGLDIRSNLIFDEGVNYTLFTNGGLKLVDGSAPYLGYTIDNFPGINIADLSDNELFSFAKITANPDPEEVGPPVFMITNSSLTSQARIYTNKIGFYEDDGRGYLTTGYFSFSKLVGNYYYGYFEFNSPVSILYPTGQNASSMPNGSILVQGDYLYYRDSSGTWKRAAIYNATPS